MPRVLFIGDIMGRTGRRATQVGLKRHCKDDKDDGYDLVIANGENAAGGFGLTERIANKLFSLGIDVITGGNHTFDKKEILPYLEVEPRLLRPANYPPGVPGHGVWLGEISGGIRLAVLNLQGRVFMRGVDDPFRAADQLVENIRDEADLIVIDFHAEATSEKMAFGWHMNGKVAAVVGTHTHVQTADARLLPGGTAYITDVGMTGPIDSVIGVRKEDALARFKLGIANRFQVAKGDPVFCAVSLELDETSGRATGISRIWEETDLENIREDDEEE
jgi:metallophosphoesterase (TIGR00282 family)